MYMTVLLPYREVLVFMHGQCITEVPMYYGLLTLGVHGKNMFIAY